MHYKSEEELMYKARQAEGRTFGDIDQSGRIENERSKGQLGQIIEESFFGYQVNSISEPDFAHLGIELKVTPVKENKNGTLSAKERLVLNIINYMSEANTTFDTSSFWNKNKEILLMFYKWLPEVKRADYRIIKSHLHKFTEEDLEIIKQDWQLINNKIKAGLAHELSEADTNYLAASTKGANKNSLRAQPFNNVSAMQRAYSLKQSYMTVLIRKIISQDDLVRITSPAELKKKTLLEILNEKFQPFIGKSLDEISAIAGIEVNHKSKSFLQLFISNLLGIKGTRLEQIDEFAKANIQLKTVRLEPNGIPKEHMSFRNIDFVEWANENWEDSWLNEYFSETKLLFIVFKYKETAKENPNRKLFFQGITLWNMPMSEIEGRLKDFFSHVQDLIQEGIELMPVRQKTRTIVNNNLPKPKFNGLCHIRPKGKDGSDQVPLPDGRMITKQAFWLDKEVVGQIIKQPGKD
ncbi:Sau3AI family type II restriction endonuclease [Sporosarcina oncorhynchi]|uniref:Sau3AI family type II restriction endonuclease n=1 Tax=Sporosarcina oncorhynchi TaxID=3056444 RepID=A0ABZ0L4B6_9BACL|nr:Sau3AI family type II restriction endonuclease [Sporosarcina sp. T2O-4]WOV87391.1 Sau3AI family type II restriction endonuclease [Sporosarcina sp. T2O-4]